jgi:hypothetical protein
MPFCSKPLGAALSIAAIAAVTMASPGRAQQDPPAAGPGTAPQTAMEPTPPQGPAPDVQTPVGSAPISQAPSPRADTIPPSRRLPQSAPARPGAGKSAVVTAKVNLRGGPGTDSEIITTIPAGSAVRVADCSEWCAVTWNGRSGYVIARNLGPGAVRHAGAYPGQPGYEDYELEPPVVYGAPGYYGPPAVVYGPAYYGPRVYGPGWGWRRRWGW